jgi:hypothetical protein
MNSGIPGTLCWLLKLRRALLLLGARIARVMVPGLRECSMVSPEFAPEFGKTAYL